MEAENKTKKVRVKRNVFEHGYLGSIASNQLSQARKENDGHRFRWIIPSMAFSVFRVEALCNIYGSQLFPHWDHFESTSFIGKIAMISEFLKIEVDFSRQPWQDLNKMKSFRNTLAHAKPQIVSEIHEIPKCAPERSAPFPKVKKSFLSYSSIENAERFHEVATELELMWIHATTHLGIEIDRVGAPKYEVIADNANG